MKAEIDIQLLAEQLKEITGNLGDLLPELWLAVSLLFIIGIDLVIARRWPKAIAFLSLLVMITGFVLLCLQWQTVHQPVLLLTGMLQLDTLGIFFKFIFCLAGIFAVLLSFSRSNGIKTTLPGARQGEYFGMITGLVLGTFLMAQSVNLLSVYLSIEFVSVCSYILTYFNFDKKSAEAGVKYILFGGVASGLMLYGMSLLYGLTGTLNFTGPDFINSLHQAPVSLLLPAILLTLAGFLFKLAAVPLHLWAPDVYEGAPTPVVALFSVAPKIAGIAVIIRFLYPVLSLNNASSVAIFDGQWLLAILAIATMTAGNLAALWQNNAKRMMAYSSIAHSGTMLIGVLVFSQLGIQSILFYASIYLLMNFSAFWLIDLLGRATGNEKIADYKGMGLQYPFAGVLMIVVMIALTGLPPTAGFTAKLLIFSALWEQYQQAENMLLFWVLLLGLLNTVVALFYYLKIPFFMFFRQASLSEKQMEIGKPVREPLRVTPFEKIMAVVLILPLILLFFQPDWIFNFITHISLLF